MKKLQANVTGRVVGRSTRKTDRDYTHCVVATASEAAVMQDTSERERAEASLASATADVARLEKEFGLTLEAACKQRHADGEVWYAQLFGRIRARREALGVTGMAWFHVRDAVESSVMEELRVEGLIDPRNHPLQGLITAGGTVTNSTARLAKPLVVLGEVIVVSWHHSEALAQKGFKSWHAKDLAGRGYTLSVTEVK